MTNAANYIFRFGNCECDGDPARNDVLGGKGASLASLSRAGFPVPPGFTIAAECCTWIHSHGGQWPTGLREQVIAAVAQLETATGRILGRGPQPLLVAVRSGAAVSMPGMMDTILNCGLNPSLVATFATPELFWRSYADHIRQFASSVAGLALTPDGLTNAEEIARSYIQRYETKTWRRFPVEPLDALVECISAVFDSWNSDRAMAYRQHHDLPANAGTAVTVQMMFPAEISGVLFTADPHDPTSGEMIVEAATGLGNAMLADTVTPDVFVLDHQELRVKRTILAADAPKHATLAAAQLRELGELGQRVAAHFGRPSDIEWGWAQGQFAVLQARPIRGLEAAAELEQMRQAEIARLRKMAAGERVVWVAHNLGETLVDPTPLTWDIVRQFISRGGGFGRLFQAVGFRQAVPDDFDFLELICGRVYVDPRRATRYFCGPLPFAYDADELLAAPETIDLPPKKFVLEKADPFFFLRVPAWAWSRWRSSRIVKSLEPEAQARFEKQTLPKLRTFLSQVAKQTLAELSTAQLLHEFFRRREFVMGELATELLLPGFLGGLAQQRLQAWLVRFLGADRGQRLTTQLIAGLEGDVTVEQNDLLFDVARGYERLDEFLDRFGHRANNEMELSQPRWREEPSYVERLVNNLRAGRIASPRDRQSDQVAERRRVEGTLAETLATYGGSTFREEIEQDLRQSQRLLPFRELGKFHFMRGYETLRAVLLELAKRWSLGTDLFFLQLDELPQFESRRDELLANIARRKRRWRIERKLVLPDTIDSENLERFGQLTTASQRNAQNRFAARPIASGVGRGTARLVFDPRETYDLGTDYVLVCPSTDPGWTPLFVNARALIVERGGMLSHGAIVARDFGIPAVVLEHATRRIPDGVRVEVDGQTGRVSWNEA